MEGVQGACGLKAETLKTWFSVRIVDMATRF